MNAEQAAHLCKLAKTISPAQAVDEFTPVAWALILEDIRFEDAREALKQLGGEQQYTHVSDVVQRVKRIRRDRVLDFGPLPDPPRHIDPDDQPAHSRWLKETTLAIADGRLTRDADSTTPDALTPNRDVIRELGQVKSVDSALATRPLREAHAEVRRTLQEIDAEKKAERAAKQARMEAMRAADRAARADLTATQRPPRALGDRPTSEEML